MHHLVIPRFFLATDIARPWMFAGGNFPAGQFSERAGRRLKIAIIKEPILVQPTVHCCHVGVIFIHSLMAAKVIQSVFDEASGRAAGQLE